MVEENVNKRGFTLTEIIIVIGVMGILLSLAGPQFLAMLRRSTLEESAQRLQETLKSAQIEAQKRGNYEFGNLSSASGHIISARKQRVYVTLYPTQNMFRVIAWSDTNKDSLKTDDEFTVIQEHTLKTGTSFSLPATINKVACNNSLGAPADSIVNFTASTCPDGAATMFPEDTRCVKLNGRGFSESMRFAAAYISDTHGETFAVTMNPAGLTDLCRWDSGNWLKLR